MQRALELAEQAAAAGEVPVGAVVVDPHDVVIGEGFNRSICDADATAHAELVALRAASRALDNYRLPGCTMVVTVEPCAMCAGALIHARIDSLVYGTTEPKTGAVTSHLQLLDAPHHNHRVAVRGGVMADASSKLLKRFFAERRKKST